MKLCECGCGDSAPIANKSIKSRGWVNGEPLRFILGHNGRKRISGIISYTVDSKTGCWIWQRSKTKQGYGNLTINNRQILAHRHVYETHKESIPHGFELDHLCCNTLCVNPDHLEPVTHAENCRRGKRAKLTHHKVKEIKRLANEGRTTSEIGKIFDVERHTISSVIRGDAWI